MPPKTYDPDTATRLLLTQALQAVRSVDYPVSLRWVYYRLIDNHGYPKTVKSANNIKQLLIKARKAMIDGWMPDTLADETRQIFYPGGEGVTVPQWIKSIQGARCVLDKGAPPRVVVMFEARAMYQQFVKYTAPYHVTLVPFGGDPSLSLKWEIAMLLGKYVLEAVIDGKVYSELLPRVLYFGDYDEKGHQIPDSARGDIEEWIKRTVKLESGNTPFMWIRCGLNADQVVAYNLPTDPERGNRYQWEALTDTQARMIIEGALNAHVDLTRIAEVKERERVLTESFTNHMRSWTSPSV